MAFIAVACSAGAPESPDQVKPRSVTAAIVGGELDSTTKGVVALAFKTQNQVSVYCSGSLVAPNLVLTARHCVAQIGDGASEEVICGASEFTALFPTTQLFVSTDTKPQVGGNFHAVREVRTVPGSNQVCGYDLALLILSGSGVPSAEATPLEPVLNEVTPLNMQFSAVGFGLQDPADIEGLTAGSRMRFDRSQVSCVSTGCPAAAANSADEFVGTGPACSGDSGGPALDAQSRVFGVTSRGDTKCSYALYSNVADWGDFLRSSALEAALLGGYTAPAWASSSPQAGAGGSSGVGGSSGGASGGWSGGAGTANGGNLGSAGSAGAADAPIAGAPSGGSTGSGGVSGNGAATSSTPPPDVAVTPTVDPTGASCTVRSDCPGAYQCYSAAGSPPGKCVPPCSVQAPSCPADYACSEANAVCTPVTASVTPQGDTSGCTVSGAPKERKPTLLAFGIGALIWIGRRRRQR